MSHNSFRNIIINTDNYKHCHYPLYPKGTEYVSSYIESRGGEFPVTMFVGLQAFIREYLMHPITLEDIDEAEFTEREQGMHFNRDNWMGILNDHGGYLPVEIEAVPEGSVLPTKNVLVQVINTDPKYWWATSFFETALLRAVWYPTTVGTISWLAKQQIKLALKQTSDNPGIVRHILHDYGARGVSSQESAALGGLAHLVNFSQSDTVPGILAAKKYYNAVDPSNSGPNSEHAGFCAWGRDDEVGAMRNMLEIYADNGVALLLTDTYDHEHAVKNIIGGELKEMVENFPGLVGIRPDSGDVVQVTSDTTEWLMENFGYTTNSKGYKVLPDYLRVVQGDGVRRESLPKVFIEMERRGLGRERRVRHGGRTAPALQSRHAGVRHEGQRREGERPMARDRKVPDRRQHESLEGRAPGPAVRRRGLPHGAARLHTAGGERPGPGVPQRPAAEEVGLRRADRAQRARIPRALLSGCRRRNVGRVRARRRGRGRRLI